MMVVAVLAVYDAVVRESHHFVYRFPQCALLRQFDFLHNNQAQIVDQILAEMVCVNVLMNNDNFQVVLSIHGMLLLFVDLLIVHCYLYLFHAMTEMKNNMVSFICGYLKKCLPDCSSVNWQCAYENYNLLTTFEFDGALL